ncbi:hypothetical protein D3C73_1222490 [compost metagenome]
MAGNQQSGDPRDDAYENRVLEQAALGEEGKYALAQAAVPEEFREVGIAGCIELAGGLPPTDPAEVLCKHCEQRSENCEDDQDPFHSERTGCDPSGRGMFAKGPAHELREVTKQGVTAAWNH